jgi:hypothetical protein
MTPALAERQSRARSEPVKCSDGGGQFLGKSSAGRAARKVDRHGPGSTGLELAVDVL